MWAEKYRPNSTREIVGQEIALAMLKKFVVNFEKQSKKAVLLYGPPGVGKNSLVYVLAKELGYNVVEFNASHFRDSSKIKEVLKPVLQQRSLFSKGNIIFIDEAEAFSYLDRGGLNAIIKLINESRWPIVFAANNLWDKKLNELRKKVMKIELKSLDYTKIVRILERICEKEDITINKDVLKRIAIKVRGDVRAAINDLQSLAFLKKVDESILNSLGEREKEESIFNALSAIFKSSSAVSVLNTFDNVNLPLDECLLWLDENLPLEYSGKELEEAYKKLSKADIFRARIIRRQHWRFLVYINALITAGIAVAKKEAKRHYVSYKKLSRLLKIWIAKQKNLKKKELARKIAKHCHCSINRAYKDLPFFEIMFRHASKQELEKMAKTFGLNDSDKEYLLGVWNGRKK